MCENLTRDSLNIELEDITSQDSDCHHVLTLCAEARPGGEVVSLVR